MFSRRNLISGLAASVAPASAIARTTKPPALAEDEATKQSRRAIREKLESHIQMFIESSSPEDAWLLNEVLVYWESSSLPFSGAEVYLASAFQEVLHRTEGYVRVPLGRIQEIKDALAQSEGGAS